MVEAAALEAGGDPPGLYRSEPGGHSAGSLKLIVPPQAGKHLGRQLSRHALLCQFGGYRRPASLGGTALHQAACIGTIIEIAQLMQPAQRAADIVVATAPTCQLSGQLGGAVRSRAEQAQGQLVRVGRVRSARPLDPRFGRQSVPAQACSTPAPLRAGAGAEAWAAFSRILGGGVALFAFSRTLASISPAMVGFSRR